MRTSLVCFIFLVGTTNAADDTCRLWLATSHLNEAETPRFGLYAGVDYKKNETLPFAEIALPFVDFLEGPLQTAYPDVMPWLETFFWTADYAGAKWEGNHSSVVYVPGIGVLSQYHSAYSNIDWRQASVLQRQLPEFWESSSGHPSRGAISSYYNMTMQASADIPVGMELFANFGDSWDSYTEDIYEQALNRWDYMAADQLLGKMYDYSRKYQQELSHGDLGMDVVDFMRETILGPHHGRRAKSIRSLLPPTPKKVQEAHQLGGTFLYRNRDMIKSQEWLQTRGICVDNMEIKTSTIPGAGFGAFATRDFKEGERIAISPMILIADKKLLDMYKIHELLDENGGKMGLAYDFEQPIGQQLAMNYAFGHAESSILFLPTAPLVSYINHDSDYYNAYVDWSDHDYLTSRDEVNAAPLKDLKTSWAQQSVVFHYIAVQDIKKGDEILIDYGDDWEEAWEQYNEALPKTATSPAHAMDVAKQYIDQPFPTDLKVGKIPYPKGVVTACYIQVGEPVDGRPKNNAMGQAILPWTGPATPEAMKGGDLVVCDLISSAADEFGSYAYTVKARLKVNNEIAQIEGVPHSAITLVDRPYTSAIHTPGAFRHWIEIDDQRFPQQWRDLRL
jgi:hypothetical protein